MSILGRHVGFSICTCFQRLDSYLRNEGVDIMLQLGQFDGDSQAGLMKRSELEAELLIGLSQAVECPRSFGLA